MKSTAIIGGTGFDRIDDLIVSNTKQVSTDYGNPSAALVSGLLSGKPITFLPRHGVSHAIAPHKINYRANIKALKDHGVEQIIALAAVGGISADLTPGDIVIPDQLIDYSWGREHTFFDGNIDSLQHIEFTRPYTVALRQYLVDAAVKSNITIVPQGTYAVTQGPRLETAAEIDRLERDGATIVGMTGMPEAALARELEMDYVCIAIVVNAAAGRSDIPISMAYIRSMLEQGSSKALKIVSAYL